MLNSIVNKKVDSFDLLRELGAIGYKSLLNLSDLLISRQFKSIYLWITDLRSRLSTYLTVMNKLWTNLKSWYGVVFLVLLAGGVLWFVLNGMPFINNLRENWEAQRLQDEWEKPYREDTYGGKTPEETYDMFLEALRKGDTTLASKYFEIESQNDWVNTLSKLKDSDKLSNLISELEYAKTIWRKIVEKDKEIITFEYEAILNKNSTVDYEGQKLDFPAGKYMNSTEFHRYPNGIWKIYAL